MKNKSSLKRAFTLIEMLIAVALIGICIGVAVPALNTAKENSLESKRQSILAALSTAKARHAQTENKALSADETQRWEEIFPYVDLKNQNFTSGYQLKDAIEKSTGYQILLGPSGTSPQFTKINPTPKNPPKGEIEIETPPTEPETRQITTSF